ncbi:MAG: YlbF family regulator [Oscillospiraceae bacterium]
MNVIELTRQLGKALQEDARYTAFVGAKEASDGDKALQDLIGQFNLLRMNLNTEMSKPEKDNDRLKTLDADIRALYDEIMENEHMAAYNTAKDEIDKLLESVNFIITMAANGEDPLTCPEEKPHSCSSGGCSSCSGCH